MLTKFEGPANWADRYGSRIRGYICAPATGNYTFYISSDNSSELWLSSSDNPANRQKIAWVSGYTKVYEWGKYPEQQSQAIALQQGQRYYIEVLHRENTEGDHVEVGWRMPNGVMERPIPGSYLSPFGGGSNIAVTITSPANNTSYNYGTAVNIAATVSNGTAQKVEFYADGSKIGEDASAPYSYSWSGAAQGSHTLTAVAVPGATSSAVVITIGGVPQNCASTGSITREVWNNVTGTDVNSIPVSAPPSAVSTLTWFKAPSNSGDNFGERVRGYICPPSTGNYTFWIASDDNSELWLSTDGSPANKQKIAYVNGYTQSQEYTKYPSQKSAPVSLQANTKYYIEALHKEGSQGDNLAVGWQIPGGALERPIPGSRLAPFASSPLAAEIDAPADQSTYNVGASFVIAASASGGTGVYQKMEFFDEETKLGEDLSAPFTFTVQSAHSGTYHLSVKVTDSQSATAVSDDVHVFVSGTAASCTGTGQITRELWNEVPGTTVGDIPLSTSPDVKQQLTIFRSSAEIGDNYGQRIRGYICPPQTGTYYFYISSDDNSELWLGTGESAGTKQLIATVTGWTFPDEWTKYTSQTSAGISLTAGQKYYIEALHKEGTQGDHLEVGWKLANGTFERPIPGNRLIPFEEVPVAVCEASIQPGSSTTFCSGGNVTLFANQQSGYNYQWKKDDVEITGATSYSYYVTSQGAYQVRITYPGCNAWSAPTYVTVNDFLTARITAGGPTTFCEGESVTLYGNTCEDYIYQWKRDGEDIQGANGETYVATVSGSYQLKIISGSSISWSALQDVTVNDCGQSMKTSQSQESLAKGPSNPANDAGLASRNAFNMKVFPNPTTGMFTFNYCIEETKTEIVEIRVINVQSGATVYRKGPEKVSGCVRAEIGLSGDLPVGVYVLQLVVGQKTESTKLILCR
jgi:hypothetical protein